jgi:hypothetical protein
MWTWGSGAAVDVVVVAGCRMLQKGSRAVVMVAGHPVCLLNRERGSYLRCGAGV